MNRNGHLIFSEFFLVVVLFAIISVITGEVPLLTIGSSIFAFLFGVCAPDLDHPAVQKKARLKFLGRHTRHRGHFHSLIGVGVYGLIVLLPSIFLMTYWLAPVIFGMFGYFSHLLEDDMNSIYKRTKRNAIKIW